MKSLEELRKALSNQSSENSPLPTYRFYNMPANSTAVVRFVPDADDSNPFDFFVRNYYHMLPMADGSTQIVPCAKGLGTDIQCPVCAVSTQFYNQGDEENGQKYWRKVEYITQALILKDPMAGEDDSMVGKLALLRLRKQIFQIIENAIMTGEIMDNPADYEKGTNFNIKKTVNGKRNSYIMSRFDPNPTPLPENVVSVIDSQRIRLADVVPQFNMEVVQNKLDLSLSGGSLTSSAAAQVRTPQTPQTSAAPASAIIDAVDNKDVTPWEDSSNNSVDEDDVMKELFDMFKDS